MRVVAEVPHPQVKITIFSWNGKYLIKLENAFLEQTYKVSEMDIMGEEEVKKLLDDTFMEKALARFAEMGKDWHAALNRLEEY